MLWASVSSITAAQIQPGEVERDRAVSELRQYHGFIDDYRRGNTEGLKQLAGWDKKRIQRVLASVETTKDPMRPWSAVRFKAAVMVHTDLALDLLEGSEIETALLHLDVASQLLKKAGPDGQDHVGRWYQAVVGRMRSRYWLRAAEQFLASGRDRWPRDPIVLYESGTLEELFAGDTSLPTVVNVAAPRTTSSAAMMTSAPATAPLPRGAVDALKRHRLSALNRAAGWLQEALKHDPYNVQAVLHLGRVQMLRNHHADALELLGQASRSSNLAVAYLGLLFTAALHERQGRQDDARQAYGDTIAIYPLNQAAHIGLSALLQRTGRGDQSRALLRGVVDARPASRRDPWWTYFQEPSVVVLARLEALRQEVRQ
jgi:tetratricopeptide (TPR) repeat protein